MLLTSSDLRAVSAVEPRRRLWNLGRIGRILTLLLALAALIELGIISTAQVAALRDDLRYGWPRTTHLDGFVGHQEGRGIATHLIAVNLGRQVVLIEFPGGDAAAARVLVGPYLFGARSDRTPVRMELRDVDRDGAPDLLLDIDDEWLVYLNKNGDFRLPTDDEQRRVLEGAAGERGIDGKR